jgi:signal transduction histidine kinase
VADECGGIPPGDLPRVFDVAFRGESARTPDPSGGAGLGLSIAHGIVQAHGGRIELERLARGSRFRVVLPVEAADHIIETGERRLTDVAALVPGGPAQGGNHRG